MRAGENEPGITRVFDMIRVGGFVLLMTHFYYYNYSAFRDWGLTAKWGDAVLANIGRTGIFSSFNRSKLIALGPLLLSFLGTSGGTKTGTSLQSALFTTAAGLLLYVGSAAAIRLDMPLTHIAVLYMTLTIPGYIMIVHGTGRLGGLIRLRMKQDIFNRLSQNFPQEERVIHNGYSIHFPAIYEYRGRHRESVINIPNIFRGLLICGGSGSGKTYFIIKNLVRQEIELGFSMLVYDFKYPDLSKLTYNYFLANKHRYPGKPAFYHINFEDLTRTNRCNCLAPYTLGELADAIESARSVLFGLNMDWVSKQGDFWVESSINFVAGIIWFLRKHQDGKYCTWPHVIELAGTSYRELFSVLRAELEIQTLIRPFVDAFMQNNHEQLGGQIGSANIGMARLSSPAMYYVLTGNDFTLDLNNPEYPKVLTLANSPQKANTYGAFLSVFINTINRLACRENMHPFAEVIDEASTITATSIIQSIGQGRSYKIAVTLAIQDVSQLKLSYGQKFADVILNLCGNVISGQVTGDSARWLSERFGKTMQDRESMTMNVNDTSITRSQQLEQVIPPSRIASLSSGEFVGMVADTPEQAMELKMFCCRILNNHKALKKEEESFIDLPVLRNVTPETVLANYVGVKADVKAIIGSELKRMQASQELRALLLI